MVSPGQLCVSVCSSACLSYYLSPPPVFVPFLSLLFIFPFFPVRTSLCLCLYVPFCFFAFSYVLCFVLLLRLPFCFWSASLFVAYLLFLVAECVCLFYTPREACEPAICEKLRILWRVSFLDFLLSIASLPDLKFFSLSLSSLLNVSFFRFFDVRVVIFIPSIFFWVVCGLLGFCGDLYSVPHVSHTYVRGPPFLCSV